ncbi:MAG: hypothetical protein GY701_22855 [Sulfitobacter sp.]|nr:hypothetical protein [Sulfitobacter sp.]
MVIYESRHKLSDEDDTTRRQFITAAMQEAGRSIHWVQVYPLWIYYEHKFEDHARCMPTDPCDWCDAFDKAVEIMNRSLEHKTLKRRI